MSLSVTSTANRVAVLGCGHVGASAAYAFLLNGTAREIVLVDADARRAEGEAMDLQHAAALGRPVRVWAGDYADAARAQIAVIAAGVSSRQGETRLDLLGRNSVVVTACMRRLMEEDEIVWTGTPAEFEKSALPVVTHLTHPETGAALVDFYIPDPWSKKRKPKEEIL
ncbi:MAG TPA: hypothetical protein VE842_20465 [Pyrinomonadaceae bacterium]|jgi:threonine dehydrogenase-like Zn-dependent dehydrogenase|nr:hypothetical protein [Pyrinomonadaceae bacterium]